jgi:hypothetical protein
VRDGAFGEEQIELPPPLNVFDVLEPHLIGAALVGMEQAGREHLLPRPQDNRSRLPRPPHLNDALHP